MRESTHKLRAFTSYKRVLAVLSATLTGSLAMTVVVANPASASAQYIVDAGSATTYNVMAALFGGVDTDGSTTFPNPEPSAGTVYSIPPGQTTNPATVNGTSFTVGGTTYGIPPGTDCAGVIFGSNASTWNDNSTGFDSETTGYPAPNGSSQGKDALYDEEEGYANSPNNDEDCYNMARSSSAPSSPLAAPDTANFQYYAYALDAVTFIVGSDATAGAGLPAGTPAELSLQEVYNIYNCTLNNWDQVQVGVTPAGQPIHGANAPIYRFWPQSGSGTLAMAQNMLSSVALSPDNPNAKTFDPTVAAYNPNGSAPGDVPTGTTGNSNCKNGIYSYGGPFVSEENSETVVAQSTAAEDAGAIFPYSVGQFVAQWNNSADYCSFCDPATGNANFDPSLTLASLGDLGNLTNDALPYQYSESAAGNPDYPYPPYTKFSFTTGSTGNPFVPSASNAVVQVNQTVVNETNEWYEGYGVIQDLVPGVRYLYNVVDTALPSYGTMLELVGFNNTGASETVGGVTLPAGFKSPLCSDTNIGPASTGTPASIIQSQGFVPLGTLGGPVGANVAGGHCRVLAG
jgi:hypothetical protein